MFRSAKCAVTALAIGAAAFLSLPAAQEKKVVHLAEEVNWPPFTPETGGLVKTGLSYELMSAIFAKVGSEFDLECLPMARVVEYLKAGTKDGATVISQNPERAEYLAFSSALFPKRGFIYFRADRPAPLVWASYADLKGLKIGVVTGNSYSSDFEKAVKEGVVTAVSVAKIEQLPKMLMGGNIDAFMGADVVVEATLENDGLVGKIKPTAKAYVDKTYHMGISKKSPVAAMLPQINEAIAALQKDGSIRKLMTKYGM